MASQTPLSMGFLRQEYWNRLPFPSPSYLPNAGIEPMSPASEADSLPSELSRKLNYSLKWLMLNLVLLPKKTPVLNLNFLLYFMLIPNAYTSFQIKIPSCICKYILTLNIYIYIYICIYIYIILWSYIYNSLFQLDARKQYDLL